VTEYTIQGIPVNRTPPRARFPIKHLEIGQSFLVPFNEEVALRRAATNYNSTHRDRKISCRIEDGGVRCGRIA